LERTTNLILVIILTLGFCGVLFAADTAQQQDQKKQEEEREKKEAQKKKQLDDAQRKKQLELLKQQQSSLEKISTAEDKAEYSVLLHGKGKFEHNSSFGGNPPTLTLDFPNTRNKAKDKFEPKENRYVSLIRAQEYEKDGLTSTRLTVELKATFDYRVNPSEGGLTLQFSVPAAKPIVVAPPKPGNMDVLIGPEDLLEVSVFDLPQFNTTSRVAGDGTITMPLVGSIEVRGLSKKQVEQKIASALEAKYVNDANVSVNIKEYKSRQVSVLGAVKTPGPYYVISHRTLLQLLSETGGLNTDASEKCYIFREGANRIEIDLHDLMVNGNQNLNVEIYPGDVVNFPAVTKITVYVLGAVKSPGAIEMTSSMPVTLIGAIARAGGPTDSANKSGVQVRRKDENGQEQIIKVNLKEVLSGKAPDVPLQAGDIINVPESFF
jgi:polysaccharide export outer membrane protein